MERVVIGSAELWHGDCLAILPLLEPVDAVITDPPYSSGGQFRGDRAQNPTSKYVQNTSSNVRLPEFSGDTRDQRAFHFWSSLWSGAARELTKPSGIACFFTDWRQLPISTDYLQAGGWVWRGVIPWAKPAYRPQMGRFGAQCEYVIWGSNGPLPVERGVGCLPGFFNYMAPQEREHITEKPVKLLMDITRIVPPSGLALDPFMGSGTTGVACANLGRKFIGVEIDRRYFDIACERISAAQAQGRLLDEPAPPLPPAEQGKLEM